MTEQELLKIRDLAEVGQVQFKERANDRYDIGCEMVAFSNSHGGKLVIGINTRPEQSMLFHIWNYKRQLTC